MSKDRDAEYPPEAALCPSCGSRDLHLTLRAADFDHGRQHFALCRCQACNLVSTQPQPTATELARWYASEYYGSGESKFSPLVERLTRTAANRRAMGLLRELGLDPAERPCRVLDLGCGRGTLIRALARQGCDAVGVEQAGFTPHAQVPGNLRFHYGPLDQAGLQPASLDLIVVWHVLEHLGNPRQTLEQLRQLLAEKGRLVISVPNFGSWQAGLFGRHWFHLDLPRHLLHFDRVSLTGLLEQTGFEVQRLHTWSLEQGGYGFVQSALNRWLPLGTPNGLYAALRSGRQRRDLGRMLIWLAMGALLTPLALADVLLGGLFGRGAVLTLVAGPRKA